MPPLSFFFCLASPLSFMAVCFNFSPYFYFPDNNGFQKGMREFKQCVEREKIIFNVEVKDPNVRDMP